MLAIKLPNYATISRAQRVRVVAARASSSMQPNLPQTPTRKSIVSNVAMVPDAREVTNIPLMSSGEVRAWLLVVRASEWWIDAGTRLLTAM